MSSLIIGRYMMPGKIVAHMLLVIFLGQLLVACDKVTGEKKVLSPIPAQIDTALIAAHLQKANSFLQTNFDSMHYYTELAKTMAISIHNKEWEAKAKATESNYRRRKGDYSGSISVGLEAVNLYDSLGMWKEAVRSKNVLADVYKEMGGEKGIVEYLMKGIELSKQAQAVAEKKGYHFGVIISLNQQGITWRDLSGQSNRPDLLDTAFNLYERGIKIINESGEGEAELGKFYNNIAQIYNEHYKNNSKALEFAYKAMSFNIARNNQHSLTYNYGTAANTYLDMNKLDSADLYAKKMLTLGVQLKSPFRAANAYGILTAINKKMHRYDSALLYSEMGTRIDDSLNNVKKAALIAESQTRFETGKKEEKISELNKLNTVKNQRLWLAFGMVAVFAILIMVSVQQNRRLQRQKNKISEQSDRLQWMMKELHHRVKNNLQIVSSLLNLQTYRLKDEESVSAIKESQLRVQAMSLIHQRLYQVDDVSMVNFKLYLDDLIETLMRSYGYGAGDFDLEINIEKEFLDVDTVMPMGLLVNEIITNSFKYAYNNVSRPLLHISLSGNDTQLQLDIRDNGPGLDMATAEQNKHGFGKKLIKALSGQLKATWLVDSSNGTVLSF